MRLLHARHVADGAGVARQRHDPEPRGNPRTYLRQLLPLHRLSRHRRCGGIGGGGARNKSVRTHMSHHHGHNGPLSPSERADALEEEKMHEMERIITKSTIGYLMEGQVTYDTAPGMKAKHPGKFFLMGEDPRLP